MPPGNGQALLEQLFIRNSRPSWQTGAAIFAFCYPWHHSVYLAPADNQG